ncbi:MAG TPA: FecR domain-containing protein [Puia sp.]|nr:FecR domain-containing protein [Puia sp.]
MALLNKNRRDSNIDILLAKYIAGQANADESSEADRWIGAGETNKKYAEHLRLIWEECSGLSFTGSVDTTSAWQGFRHRIAERPDTVTQPGPLRRRIGWMQAAAILVVTIGIGILIYTGHGTRNKVPVILHPFSGSQVSTYHLPDGSVVQLDPNSNLSYPSEFISDQRNIHLEGGAFFTVAPDPHKPFRVAVNGITVTVLGTSFRITSVSGRTEIAVKTGSIEVAGKHRRLKLYAMEKLIAPDVDSGWTKQPDTSGNSKAYKDVWRRSSGAQLTIQKPDMRSGAQADSHPLVPTTMSFPPVRAAASDPPPVRHNPRPRIDELQMKVLEEQMKGVVSDLLSENLIKDYNSLIWFSLTDTALYINGIRERDDIQKRFEIKYNVTSDHGFFFGAFVVPKIARGMHVNRDWLLRQPEFKQ